MNAEAMQMQRDLAGQLAYLKRGTTPTAALAFFVSLPAAPLDVIYGSWRGSGLATGHPLDGLLEAIGWHGKRFDGPENVHPLVFRTARGRQFCINPALIPMPLVVHYAVLLKHPIIARIVQLLMPVLRTNHPQARLRITAFHGVSTGTMIYDRLPINDVFRMIDPNTLLGIMDMRGLTTPFFFVLRREGARFQAEVTPYVQT